MKRTLHKACYMLVAMMFVLGLLPLGAPPARAAGTYIWDGAPEPFDPLKYDTVMIGPGAKGMLGIGGVGGSGTITIRPLDDGAGASGAHIVCGGGMTIRLVGDLSLTAPDGESALKLTGDASVTLGEGANVTLVGGAGVKETGSASLPAGRGLSCDGALEISLADDARLTAIGGSGSANGGHAVYAAGELTVTAGGETKLEVKGGAGGGNSRMSGGAGIMADGLLTIELQEQAELEAAGGSGSDGARGGYGISAGGALVITTASGDFDALGGKSGADGAGICVNASDSVITAGEGKFTADGGAGYGILIKSGALSIESGLVETAGAYGVGNLGGGLTLAEGLTLRVSGSVFPLYHHRSVPFELTGGTTLEFTDEEGEFEAKSGDYALVRVTGPDAVIKGNGASYTGLSVDVDYDHADMLIENISFAAAPKSPYPTGLRFLSLAGPHTLTIAGMVAIGGGGAVNGDGGYGINSETELKLESSGRRSDNLTVTGGSAVSGNRDGGTGIHTSVEVSDTPPGAPDDASADSDESVTVIKNRLTVSIPLTATGGQAKGSGLGGAGVIIAKGVKLYVNQPITAVGGAGGTGGPGLSAGDDIVVRDAVTATGGEGTHASGGDGIYSAGTVRLYADIIATGGVSAEQSREASGGLPVYLRDPARQRVLFLATGVTATLTDGALASKTERYKVMLLRNGLDSTTKFSVRPGDAIRLGNASSREIAIRTGGRAIEVSVVDKTPEELLPKG